MLLKTSSRLRIRLKKMLRAIFKAFLKLYAILSLLFTPLTATSYSLSSLPPVLQTHESTKQKDSVQLDGSFNPRNVKEEIAAIKRNSLKEVEIDSKQESKTYKNFQASIPFYRLY
jgi:hypothetical protein